MGEKHAAAHTPRSTQYAASSNQQQAASTQQHATHNNNTQQDAARSKRQAASRKQPAASSRSSSSMYATAARSTQHAAAHSSMQHHAAARSKQQTATVTHLIKYYLPVDFQSSPAQQCPPRGAPEVSYRHLAFFGAHLCFTPVFFVCPFPKIDVPVIRGKRGVVIGEGVHAFCLFSGASFADRTSPAQVQACCAQAPGKPATCSFPSTSRSPTAFTTLRPQRRPPAGSSLCKSSSHTVCLRGKVRTNRICPWGCSRGSVKCPGAV